MSKYIATIVIEANNEKDAEEQLQAEPFRFVQGASFRLEDMEQTITRKDVDSTRPLSKLSHFDLIDRFMGLLHAAHGGDYYRRFSEIAKARGRNITSSHFSRMDTASLQLLIETIEGLRGSPELKEDRLVAEEVLRIVSTREGNLFAEDMREFIGRELDLTDAALLEAWETIEQDRMKKGAGANV